MEKNNFLIPVSILIAGALIAWGLSSEGPKNEGGEINNENPSQGEMLPISENDHLLGSPNAELILVEYSDLECPFCKNFYSTTKQLMEDYGKSEQLAIVFRHFPLDQLHSKARTEAIASECAAKLGGNTKFWEYLDELFSITPSNNGLELEELVKIAERIELDVDEFTKCQSDPKMAEKIEASFQDGVNAGVKGTPYSIILEKDGTKTPINGAQPYDVVKSTIEELLAN